MRAVASPGQVAQRMLQITCMVHDPLMLHTLDFMSITNTCTNKDNVLEGVLVVSWQRHVDNNREDVVGVQ